MVNHVIAASPSPPQSPQELEERLRPLYPLVAVFRRQVAGEGNHYYVYRDGRFRRDRPERWWEAKDAKSFCLSATTGRIMSVTPEWAELVGGGEKDLIGRHYWEFVVPTARDAAVALFEALLEHGEVRTEALVRRVDGTTLPVEFHALRQDGEIEVAYRVLEENR